MARPSYDERSRECTMFHFGIYRHSLHHHGRRSCPAARRLRKRVHRGAIAPDVEKTRGQNDPRSTFTILSSYSSCLRRSWCSPDDAAWKVLD